MSKITVSPEEQLAELKRGASNIAPEEELLKKLKKSFKDQKPLKIKFGADPSRPDIHLGHTVVLNKLKLLQDFGHEIYFIIGDFTAQIGDPTGKSKTRPVLTEEDVQKNAQTYKEQIGKILDTHKINIVFNKNWLGKLTSLDMVGLLSKVTVNSLLHREDFQNRYQKEDAIYMHEFLYPIVQAYDSVYLKSDLELGGTDQTFNLMLARDLMRTFDLEPQCILTMPILEGTDGVKKMSKSLDNYISINDTATDIFGKMMSISDDLMLRYYDLLSRRPNKEIDEIKAGLKNGSHHPMDTKKNLAVEITDYYHPKGSGEEERKKFEERFSKNKIPDDIKVVSKKAGELNLLPFLVEIDFTKSNGEGRRLLKQNAIKIDGKAFKEEIIQLESGKDYILKAGKLRMVKISVK